MGGQQSLVKTCTAQKCPLFNFKNGKNELIKRKLTNKQRQETIKRLEKARRAKNSK